MVDLTTIALKLNNTSVEKAICCFVDLVVNVTQDTTSLQALAQRCYSSILSIVKEFEARRYSGAIMNQAMVRILECSVNLILKTARIERCLIILGYICEHSLRLDPIWSKELPHRPIGSKESPPIFERSYSSSSFCSTSSHLDLSKYSNEVVASMDILAIGDCIHGPVLCGICYAVSTYILDLQGEQYATLHIRAVQALCNVFIGNPNLLILCNDRKLLKVLLAPEIYPDSVHEKLLISLKRMLDYEEVR
jgi:hypothetical protein